MGYLPFHVAAGPRFGWVPARRSCSPARKARDRAKSVLEDPAQTTLRHRRRALLLGLEMLAAGGVIIHSSTLDAMRSNERDDDAHQSVLFDEVLITDGWKRQDDGNWKLPHVAVSADDPK